MSAIGFAALGVWQVERRAWKLDLIERVESRAYGEPAPLASADRWPLMDMSQEEYRRVRIEGRFMHGRETLTRAVTAQGGGYWVVTPLVSQGGIVLVNRGFVPPDKADPSARTAGQATGVATVTGLLRASEPNGGFLRANDPQANRWYSRDVAAIARSRQLGRVAPFFIDADAAPNPGGYPVGGLTILSFRNNHLVYALTWFALSGLSIFSAFLLLRRTGPR